MKLLVIEDNKLLGASMKKGLEESGFIVDLARDGVEGQYCATNSEYHVILVDHMLPKLSGTELIRNLRGSGSDVPVIMVTSRGTTQDRIDGLDLGADDYIVKPFEMGELVARIKAVHRRSLGRPSATLELGNMSINLMEHNLCIGGRSVELTSKEFDLLACLAGKPGRVFGHGELMSLLYELNEEPESNSMNVLLARLRKKLAGATGIEIATIRGKGFVLRVESAPS